MSRLDKVIKISMTSYDILVEIDSIPGRAIEKVLEDLVSYKETVNIMGDNELLVQLNKSVESLKNTKLVNQSNQFDWDRMNKLLASTSDEIMVKIDRLNQVH